MTPAPPPRQGQLFPLPTTTSSEAAPEPLPLLEHQLREWQERLEAFQSPRFDAVARGAALSSGQIELFNSDATAPDATVLRLDPLALAAYGEALQQAGLDSQLSIRFWRDAPSLVRPRRALEQALIRHWLPPFNKETRGRWATPFTAGLD